jgi:hypothetical protein
VEPFDRFLQAFTLDEAHDVKRTTIRVGPQPVDWHHARVLQTACDFGFEHEASAVVGHVGVRLDLLDGHFALELAVMGHENFTESAFGMRTQNAEPSARRGWRAQENR